MVKNSMEVSIIKTKLLTYILVGVGLIIGTWFCAGMYYHNETASAINQEPQSPGISSDQELDNRYDQAVEKIKVLNKKVEDLMFQIEGLRSQNRRLGDDYTLLDEKYNSVLKEKDYYEKKFKEYGN